MFTDKLPMMGQLHIFQTSESGEVLRDETIKNLIVTVGKTAVASSLVTVPGAAFGWMAVGTGTTAAALADTTLGAEAARVASSTSSSSNVATFVGTYGAGVATAALTEAGLFNVVTANSGTLLSHVVFAVVNKGATDTLVITWTVTCG
jgi:hypothetical protein